MKKIFIQRSTLYLAGKNGAQKIMHALEAQKIAFNTVTYKSKVALEQEVSRLAAGVEEETILIVHDSSVALEKTFFSSYKLIYAAGGAVINDEGKLLMIFRRGKWDLPKGKVDRGETIRRAALREVEEETGVSDLKIISPIKFLNQKQDCTYHTYELNGAQILKGTYWFKMWSTENKKLMPQAAEGIMKAEWCTYNKVQEYLKNSFQAIEEIVREVL
ncbi:MAG: NUDIX domain-containing protein [Chitinophagales bacterium]